MSRQWGHWRLGRGDGGHYSEVQSLARLLRTSWGARSAGALNSTSTAHIVRIARAIAYSNCHHQHCPSSIRALPRSLDPPVHFHRYSSPRPYQGFLVPTYHTLLKLAPSSDIFPIAPSE